MKFVKLTITSLFISTFLLTSCATVFGGSKYNAHIVVVDKPNAKILYKGETRGTGTASISVKRKEAKRFTFSVKEDGCEEQQFNYTSRTFRGWAFAGSIAGSLTFYIPMVAVDLITGALWKPNTNESGVSQEDYKDFKYLVNYTKCPQSKSDASTQLLDGVYLKNGSVIKGIIVEHVPNVQIKIQTKDGNIFVYKFEEIEKITKEQTK